MQFKKRGSLLFALIVGELTCLVLGVLWFARRLDHSMRDMTSYQVLRDNGLIASQFAKLIEQMELRELTAFSADWNRLQTAVEDIRLPNSGFVCVTDHHTGALLCHPKLRSHPEMARMTPGKARLETDEETQPIIDLVDRDGAARGRAEMKDGIHLIAARRIPALNANVMVHQRMAGIQESVAMIVRPVYAIGLTVAVMVVAATLIFSLLLMQRYENQLAVANTELESVVARRTRALMKTRNATIFGLAKLAESRDTDTGDHLERIRDYAVILAENLGRSDPAIDPSFISDLGLASSLHDIGKVGIPDAILLKPGRLTPEERTIMEQHAAIGGQCLAEIERRLGEDDFLEMAREIAFAHHERWDGTGYPYGLREQEIPVAARIVAVADVYDALTSKRPYKDAMEHKMAYDLIVKGSGTQFDPRVVAAFVAEAQAFAGRASAHRSPLFDELDSVTESVEATAV